MKSVRNPRRITAPRYLFHWTSAAALKEIAGGASTLKLVPIVKTIAADSVLHEVYSQLRRRPVLFAWSHPVTAMASNGNLIYAGEDAADARVLILEVKENPSILFLSTPKELAKARLIDESAVASADLIYNEIEYRNGTLVREWLILDPAAIRDFTADPEALRPFFRDEAARLRAPAREYPKAAFHNYSAPFARQGSEFLITLTSIPSLRKTIVIPRLKAMARLKSSSIPAPLRRPFTLDPGFLASCSSA